MKRWRSGFTLVELVVVIATIGILATITVIGLTRYQADTRDAKRATSVGVISEALEKYYDENGEYPSCTEVMAAASTVTVETLKGVSATAIKTPQAPAGQSNSIECEDISIDGTDLFEYEGDGSAACSGSTACLSYTLKYKEESSGQIKTLTSRRNTSIATSGAPTISVNDVDFDNITVQWTSVPNASSYLVQRSNTASFTSPADEETVSAPTLTAVMDGLSTATTYYFRVRPNATESTGNWSNTISSTTASLAAPSVTATANSGTQITVNWGAVSGAVNYTLDYSTVSNFSSNVITYTGLTTTSRVITGLNTGVQYFFRVKAVNGAFSSAYGTANTYTVLPAPVCSATTGSSNTQIVPDWNASTGASTYTVQYGPSNYNTEITGITGTFTTINGLSNGTTYTSRVKAVAGTTSSAWTNCPNRTTGIDGPSSYGWYAEAEAVRNSGSIAWMPGAYPGGGNWWTNGMTIYGSCGSGATIVTRLYSYYANSSNGNHTQATLMDWTWNNQTRFVVNGTGGYHVWWQGWVACQVGGTRVGDVYLGNPGPY